MRESRGLSARGERRKGLGTRRSEEEGRGMGDWGKLGFLGEEGRGSGTLIAAASLLRGFDNADFFYTMHGEEGDV